MRPLAQLYEQYEENANRQRARAVSARYTREDLLALAGYIERCSHEGAFEGLAGREVAAELVDNIYLGYDTVALRAALRAQCRRTADGDGGRPRKLTQEAQLFLALFGDQDDRKLLDSGVALLLGRWRDVHMNAKGGLS